MIGSTPRVGVKRADRLAGLVRSISGLVISALKSADSVDRRLERVEAAGHRVDLFFVTGEAEQGGCVTPR